MEAFAVVRVELPIEIGPQLVDVQVHGLAEYSREELILDGAVEGFAEAVGLRCPGDYAAGGFVLEVGG